MGSEKCQIQDGQLIYSMILSSFQSDSSSYFLKWRSCSVLSILCFTPYQKFICSNKPIPYLVRNTPKMYSAQTSYFNSISTILSTGLNVYFHQKLLPANTLIILTIKIGHYTFPLSPLPTLSPSFRCYSYPDYIILSNPSSQPLLLFANLIYLNFTAVP